MTISNPSIITDVVNVYEGGSQPWTPQTTNYNASPGNRIIADMSSAAWTLTLPATPSVGDEIQVLSVGASTNALTVNPNGTNLNGAIAPLTISTDRQETHFIYVGSAGWVAAVGGGSASTGGGSTPTPTPTQHPYVLQVLGDLPDYYYRLGETSGMVVADKSGNSRNGAMLNCILDQPGLLAGDTNPAMGFDGTTSLIYAPLVNSGVQQSRTLECLVSIPSTPSRGTFIKLGTPNNGLSIGIGSGTHDSLGFELIGLIEVISWLPSNTSMSPGVHHVALTFEASENLFVLYLDGQSVAQFRNTPIAPTNWVGIGGVKNADNTPGRGFSGVLDEIAIYSTALSAAKIFAHANARF